MTQSKTDTPEEKAQQNFRGLLHKFDTAMLVTHASPGSSLHGRPMAIAEVGDDGSIWFISRADAPKIDEIDNDREIVAILQQPKQYLSVSGRAALHRDRARIDKVWKESFRAWFDGKDDPNIVLIQLKPHEAEYWDNAGVKGLRFALQYAAAYVSGRELTGPGDVDQHAKVHL